MSDRQISLQTSWSDQSVEAKSDCYERKLAAICSIAIESERGDSTYSFSGIIRYRVAGDHRQVHVEAYDMRGIHIDGPHLGTIECRAKATGDIEVAGDRRFSLETELLWTDGNNADTPVRHVLQGSLSEDCALAQLSTSISGKLTLGDEDAEYRFRSPALW